MTVQQLRIGNFLTNQGIRFEYEKIWLNGDRVIYSDLWLPDHKLTIEFDGEIYHARQARYDTQRSLWLANTYGMATIRSGNGVVDSGFAERDIAQRLSLGQEI